MPITAYLDSWLETYIAPRRAQNTVRAYRYALAHLSPDTGAQELADVDALTLQREINSLAAVYPRQAQLMYTALHAALKKALRLGLVAANPMDLVDPPEHQARESEILTPAECQAYVDEAAGREAGPLLILMLCLGLRRNEARGLRFGDMDGEGVLHLRHQRTRDGFGPLKSHSSRRDIPVPPPLRPYLQGPRGEYVCDLSEKSLRTQHRRVLAAIGVRKNVTLHGLRHSCATMAIVAGAELVTVQQLLGHKHISLTADLYTHRNNAIMRRCTDAIIGMIAVPKVHEGARLEIV